MVSNSTVRIEALQEDIKRRRAEAVYLRNRIEKTTEQMETLKAARNEYLAERETTLKDIEFLERQLETEKERNR